MTPTPACANNPSVAFDLIELQDTQFVADEALGSTLVLRLSSDLIDAKETTVQLVAPVAGAFVALTELVAADGPA